jgi:hypothetical protein
MHLLLIFSVAQSSVLDIQVDKSRVSSPRGKRLDYLEGVRFCTNFISFSPNSTTALHKSSSKGSGVKGKKVRSIICQPISNGYIRCIEHVQECRQ